MIFTPTRLQDAVIIDVERRGDERGYLARTYCEQEFADHGLVTRFVQASTIFSPERNTLRGLHFQEPPHGEVKLVRCTRGAARVTIVDLRPDSPTHTQWLGVELSPENGRLLYVPKGFAQGYQTLVDDTEVATRCRTSTSRGGQRRALERPRVRNRVAAGGAAHHLGARSGVARLRALGPRGQLLLDSRAPVQQAVRKLPRRSSVALRYSSDDI